MRLFLVLNLREWMVKKILRRLLETPCPEYVEEESEDNNFFSIYIEANDSPFLVVGQVEEDGLAGSTSKGEAKASMPFQFVKFNDIVIHHYYKGSKFPYHNMCSYIVKGLTGFDRVRANLGVLSSEVRQYFFNKSELIFFERIELLRSLVGYFLDFGNKEVNTLDFMTYLYGSYWARHPRHVEAERKLELYFKSFVDSGDLEQSSDGYVFYITGKAINTLEEYEREQKRHKEYFVLQVLLVALTLLIAISTMAQSGLIELPTLINLSRG